MAQLIHGWARDGANYNSAVLPKKIDHFRIESLLGRGGMGSVYRAYDEQLERQVAIKLIPAAESGDPDEAADSMARERFRREARSAAKLDHPAIVQIHHILTGEDHDGIVMEYVEGRTLAQLLRDGPLPPSRAAVLFREIAEGLAEAHDHQIVHRDVKAENVMVTPEGHAKILDFGIAKRLEPNETALTAKGTRIGTPSTMSPEQIDGHEVDHRSDLFSLGVVLYEALTGVPPFRAERPSKILVRILTHNPRPVAKLDPKIPSALSELIVRLLQKDRRNRPQSAAEVAAELDHIADASVATTLEAPEGPSPDTLPLAGRLLRPWARYPTKYLLMALAMGTAAILASMIWHLLPGGIQKEPSPAASSPLSQTSSIMLRPAVAVLGFDNLSNRPEHAWVATAMGEMLVTELRAGGEIRVIDSSEVARARRELAVNRLTELAREDLAQWARSLGVGLVVWGSYSDVTDRSAPLLRIDLRLQEATSGVNLASEGATGTLSQLFALVDRVAEKFRQQLEADPLTPADQLAAKAALPAGAEALQLYFEGLARLRQLDALAARDLLQAAIAAEPEHPMPHAALAEAWSVLGYEGEARSAASQAKALAGQLSEAARQQIEARYHAAGQEWDQASQIFETLFASSPDDLEVGVQLMEAQIEAGKIPEALVTAEALSRLPEPLGNDPRVDITQARAYYRKGQLEQTRILAAQAAQKGKDLGAPLVVASARIVEAAALQDLGKLDRVIVALKEAKALFEKAGDRQGSAKTLELMAVSTLEQGDLAGARRLFEKASEVYREIGNLKRVAGAKGSIGSILVNQGRLREAVEVQEEILTTLFELGDQRTASIILNNLGFNLFSLGEWQSAITRYTEALALSDELQDKQGAAFAYTNIAEILYVQGELDRAQEMHAEALAINRASLDQVGIAYDTFRLGKVLAAKGDLFAARQKYTQALTSQDELGNAAAAAETRMELAVLELVEGRATAAEDLARQSEEVLRTEGWSDQAALAGTILVRALLASGRREKARQAMASVEADAAESEDRRVQFTAAIATARVRATSPEEALAAVEDLDGIAAEAIAAGYVEESFEARLAAGEIQMSVGEIAAGTARLAALESTAREHGFGQIARRVTAARKP